MRTRTLVATLLAAASLPVSTLAVTPHAGAAGSTATGTVFWPNPVQSTGNQSLTDSKDADLAAFASAYRTATLTDLDGSGRLRGAYVAVKSSTGKAAVATNGVFPAYHRDQDQFEQVMAYYWVTKAQRYLQHLGFGSTLRPVNQRRIEVRIDQYGGDNSFFRDDKPTSRSARAGWTTPRTRR